jgi:lipoprotein-anchoring transpeptidase ErfK/SrfK
LTARVQPAPTAAARAEPAPSYIATVGAATPYSATPGAPAEGVLPATNPFGAPNVVAVIGRPDHSGWLHVDLPVRPNGTTGWIREAGVDLSETYYRVQVALEARTVTVTYQGRPVLITPAAIGAPATPTPPGATYLWELIRPDDPNGAYGPYIFGLGWFSDSYAVFNGGDAQIGIHGQDEPWSIGKPVSHGCVRLQNSVITALAGMLPLGTPVTIG